MALIPVTYGGVRLGLLQFNDHRKGKFDAKTIALLEELANIPAMRIVQISNLTDST